MLRLTAFCPSDETDAVVTALQEEPRVHNVVRLPAVNLETGGDMVTASVRDGAVDGVLARLREVREWRAGDLSFTKVDLIARHDLARLDLADGDEDEGQTIGWETMQARAQAEARLSWHYLVFMACAGLIAALGVSRALSGLLVGIETFDLPALGGALAVLGVVAFLAALVPALRASRVNPVRSLKSD